MIFKEEWSDSQKQFDAFWDNDMLDRCCISVCAPRDKPINVGVGKRNPRDLSQKWLDTEFRYKQFLYNCSRTFYGGEAFPNFQINLGPGALASFMGIPFTLREDTVWFGNPGKAPDWSSLSRIGFNENSPLWKVAYEMTDYFTRRAGSDYLVCNTDLGGTLDVAASVRGTEQLLMDLHDDPEEVTALLDRIDDAWIDCYDRLQDLINQRQEGSTDWYPTWCREKRSYAIQNDFTAMLSPADFEKFAVPSLIRQAKTLDRAIYHWDGPGQIPHLDHLLEMDDIDGIQWVPTDLTNGSCEEKWYPLYRKIQAKGKKLILVHVDPAKVERLLANISPKGLMLAQIWCKTEIEARDLIKLVERCCQSTH